MEEYSIFEAIYLSFFSKSLYRQVATTWGGKTFLYALLIVVLSWIFAVINIQHRISYGYSQYSQKLVAQVPVMTITGGKITTPQNRPYVVKGVNDLETLIVIDTSGQYQSLQQADTDLLITGNNIITKSGNETKILKLPSSLNYTLVPVLINGFLKTVVGYLWVLLLPLFALIAWMFLLVKVLFYAIVGRIFSAVTRAHLSYGQCYLLGLVATTPALTLLMIFDECDFVFPHEAWVIFAVTMSYLFFGIIVNKPSIEG